MLNLANWFFFDDLDIVFWIDVSQIAIGSQNSERNTFMTQPAAGAHCPTTLDPWEAVDQLRTVVAKQRSHQPTEKHCVAASTNANFSDRAQMFHLISLLKLEGVNEFTLQKTREQHNRRQKPALSRLVIHHMTDLWQGISRLNEINWNRDPWMAVYRYLFHIWNLIAM